jgi:hypothetical protein
MEVFLDDDGLRTVALLVEGEGTEAAAPGKE